MLHKKDLIKQGYFQLGHLSGLIEQGGCEFSNLEKLESYIDSVAYHLRNLVDEYGFFVKKEDRNKKDNLQKEDLEDLDDSFLL